MNQKNLRVKKLVERGVIKVDRIARKLGYGNPPSFDGIDRVIEALTALGFEVADGEVVMKSDDEETKFTADDIPLAVK